MGTVIRFPDERRAAWSGAAQAVRCEPGSIVILPVIRIERQGDDAASGIAPEAGTPGGGSRRRPAKR